METKLTQLWRRILASCLFVGPILATAGILKDEFVLHTFQRLQLTDDYFSEGANAGDIDGDGKLDIVSGPYWYRGPEFRERHEIYAAVPQNRRAYADNFFSWVYDFNSDGAKDVFVVGFPGTPAYVYENPKSVGSTTIGRSTPCSIPSRMSHLISPSSSATNDLNSSAPSMGTSVLPQ